MTVEISTALARALDELAASIDADATLIREPLGALIDDVQLTVLSYAGLRLTLADHGHPVTLTVFDPGVQAVDIRTTVRLPIRAMSPLVQPGSVLVFYAHTRGAFVGLAADLGHALQLPVTSPDRARSGRPPTEWDAAELDASIGIDLADVPQVLVSELTGVAEQATIHRAIGVLLDRGHHPSETHRELSRHAALAGQSPAAYATQLLGATTQRREALGLDRFGTSWRDALDSRSL